jgi:hypothetical protein
MRVPDKLCLRKCYGSSMISGLYAYDRAFNAFLLCRHENNSALVTAIALSAARYGLLLRRFDETIKRFHITTIATVYSFLNTIFTIHFAKARSQPREQPPSRSGGGLLSSAVNSLRSAKRFERESVGAYPKYSVTYQRGWSPASGLAARDWDDSGRWRLQR